MSLLSKVLFGIGSYLVKKGEYDQQRARDELLFNRELALKNMEIEAEDKRSARDHQERIGEIEATGAQNRLTAVTTAAAQQAKDEASDDRDLYKAITLETLKQTHAKELKSLEHKYNIGENEASQRLANQLSGGKIAHWETTSDGRMVGYDQYGHTIAQTKTPGVFPVPGAKKEGDDSLAALAADAGIGPKAGSSGQTRTAAAPTPKLSAPPKDFVTRYNAATPETAPGLFKDGKKIPINDAFALFMGK